MRFLPSRLLTALLGAMITLLSSCSLMHGAFMEGATDAESTGKLLRVTMQPASLGYDRLGYHSQVNPRLAAFIRLKGYPDYLIENRSFSLRQLVMFYLKPNQAYLVELRGSANLKVTGPEPIGKKTRKLLDAVSHVEQAAAEAAAETRPVH